MIVSVLKEMWPIKLKLVNMNLLYEIVVSYLQEFSNKSPKKNFLYRMWVVLMNEELFDFRDLIALRLFNSALFNI